MKKIKKMTCAHKNVAKEENGRTSCGRCKSLTFRFGMKTYSVFKYVCLATIIVVASCFVTGCTDTDELSISESVSSSIEYENYLVAYFTFSNEVTTQNSPQIIGVINGKNVWRQTAKKIDRQLFDNAIETYEILVDKFPEYQQMNDVKKNELFNKVSMKSEKVMQLLPIDKLSPTIRLKQDPEHPTLPGFFLQWFESIAEAFQACRNYSQTNQVESGGYIFPDGRALFIIDSLATDTTMNIPIWRNGNATTNYHYHPKGTITTMSHYDSIAAASMRIHDIDSMIILTADSIYGYGF
jgi:hypothetical protein